MRNSLRSQLKDGKTTFGVTVTIGSPEIPYALGDLGLDWINFDTQHSVLDSRIVAEMIQAMSYSKTIPIVRVLSNDAGLINKALDFGANAVIVPMVNTRSDAEKAVRSARYKSPGWRSWGGRASLRDPEYTETADDEIMVIPQIETELSVRNVEEIVTTDGIDAVFVGPFDLSLSLGVFRQFESSTFQRAIKVIITSCEAHGIAPGLLAPIGSPQRSIAQGFKLISLGLDLTMLTQKIGDVMKTVR